MKTKVRKILVADDDPDVTEIYQSFADIYSSSMDEEYEFIYCKNGEDVLTYLYSESPDLIFLDLVMPKMSGLEVLNKLDSIDKTIPVVIVSGFLNDSVKENCGYNGPLHFVSKPILFHDISKYLKKY